MSLPGCALCCLCAHAADPASSCLSCLPVQELADKKAELAMIQSGNEPSEDAKETRSVDELLSFIGVQDGAKGGSKAKKRKPKKKKANSASPPRAPLLQGPRACNESGRTRRSGYASGRGRLDIAAFAAVAAPAAAECA